MKLFTALLLLLISVPGFAQLYSTSTGKVHFFSEAPLENIEATSEATKALVNTSTGEVAFMVRINSFVFDKELMREHFNDNYMESEKFPHGKFTGHLIEDINFTKDGTYDVTVKGTLTIHGVAKKRTIAGRVTVKDGEITIASKFQVVLEEHDIEIPKLVMQNIAETIDVDILMTLTPKP